MASPPVLSFSLPWSSIRISSAWNCSCDVTVSVPVIVSPSVYVSLSRCIVAIALGALNDLNSGKRGIPLIFVRCMWWRRGEISCCLRIQIWVS